MQAEFQSGSATESSFLRNGQTIFPEQELQLAGKQGMLRQVYNRQGRCFIFCYRNTRKVSMISNPGVPINVMHIMEKVSCRLQSESPNSVPSQDYMWFYALYCFFPKFKGHDTVLSKHVTIIWLESFKQRLFSFFLQGSNYFSETFVYFSPDK